MSGSQVHPLPAAERRLARSATILLESGDADAARFAADLLGWASPRAGAGGLEASLGFVPGWRERRAILQRRAILLALREQFFAQPLSYHAAARAIWQGANRYASTSWPRDRSARRCPDGINALFYALLQLGDPPGIESIRKELAG